MGEEAELLLHGKVDCAQSVVFGIDTIILLLSKNMWTWTNDRSVTHL